MLHRCLVLSLSILTFVFFSARTSFADDKANVHEGKVVKTEDGKLTMTSKDGKEHSHKVAKDAKITLDDKTAKLEDLKKGYHIKVTMSDDKEVTKIEAHSKEG
jgi:hypothetical protein